MAEDKDFYEMFERGSTYKQIAKAYNCSRSTVASIIYDYRKENNLPVKYPKKANNTKHKSNMSKEQRKHMRQRIKALKECPVREDGVIQCPPGGYAHPI